MAMWKDFYYGCAYYPEAWPENRWADDLTRMADTGFNVVRLGEGAWSYWEPAEGVFQFELFDRVIGLCQKNNIKVIMGTPTYAAPAWVSTNYPEVLRADFNRIPMKHGGRRNLNYTSPKYLDLSDKLCTALAAHYKTETQIIGWQLDNEFNCHMDVSYAASDTVAFRAWLKQKYKSLDRLNAAWGTSFWSQTFDDWEQIDLPHPTVAYMNPHQLLDETRFISDCVVRFASRQASILRKCNVKWRITHNGLFSNVDPTKLREPLDFWSHDHYPLFWGDGDWPGYAAKLVEARWMSQPFAIMEQQSGPGGQMAYLHRTPRPGEMRQWVWQSIAHGAGTFLYFRWRTCPYGSEQHWHGLIEPDNRNTRRLAEAKTVGEEIRKLPRAFFDANVTRAVAVLRDHDCEANDRRINTYNKEGHWEAHRYLAAFVKQHVPSDMLWDTSDLAGYRLIVAPHLAMISKQTLKDLTAFVKAGGTLVLGAQTGTMTQDLHLIETAAPAILKSLAGVEVEDWTTLPAGESRTALIADGTAIPLKTVVERLRLRGAKVLASWSGDDTLLDRSPAITLRKVGKGQVLYIGGYALNDAVAILASRLLSMTQIAPIAGASDKVELLERRAGKKRFITAMNFGRDEETITELPKGMELLTGQLIAGELILPALGVAVIEVK